MKPLLPTRRPEPHLPSMEVEPRLPPPLAQERPDVAEDEIDLREVLMVLRRRIWLILAVAALVAGVAGYFVYRTPAEYRARAVVRVKDNRGALTQGIGDGVASEMLGRKADPVLSQVEVLKSRALAGLVVDRVGLRLGVLSGGLARSELVDVQVAPGEEADTMTLARAGTELVARGRRATGRAGPGAPLVAGPVRFAVPLWVAADGAVLELAPREVAINRVLKQLQVTVRENTDVVDIAYTDRDARMAREVANAFLGVFQDASASSARQDSRRRREFVESQLHQTDSLLATYQQALSEFRSREQLYSAKDRYAAEQQNLLQLQTRREELAAQLATYRQLLARAGDDRPRRGRAGDDLRTLVAAPEVASNPVVSQLYGQLVQLEATRDSLTGGRWGSARTNPDVARVDTMILTTRQRILSAARSYVTSLEARVGALDQLQGRNQAALGRLPGAEGEELRLGQQVEITRNLADQLRSEYQKSRIEEAVQAGQVQVVDMAPLPTVPIGMGPVPKIALALLLGLMLGSGGAFVVEHMNTAIRRRDEIEPLLHVPELALIPRIATADEGLRRLLPSRAGNGNGAVQLVAAQQTRSSGAEAYRRLRTNLIFSQAVQAMHTIVVTSPAAGEGKTTTTTNLAATFTQQGMRVVLVDADLRKPRVHKVMQVHHKPGVLQVLIGESDLEEAVCPTHVDRLWVLPAGGTPHNAAELLATQRMRAMIQTLADRFDVVLIDTPPVNLAADAAVLGTIADGVILVLRAGHTDRAAAREAMSQLASVGARVLGAVLNDPDAEVPRYDPYYGRENYYRSYYGEKV